ncbi:uncharacterized protein LOC117425550 isoform X1 [Acipenser ruthenus]|uniref:uncharacterized protein LOC117425550 isoform X1 n=1 Tax=Acipenser ruthenus TaxID=7906 RepID=UPI00156103B9|nr:uncharacterized protein LOC117425550 isoform X1 [Acipenser ruthenus]
MSCTDSDYFVKKANTCCKKCKKGERWKFDCTRDRETGCEPCNSGEFMDQENTSKTCRACNTCHPSSNLRIVSVCTRFRNAQCECETGFYCSHKTNNGCDYCNPVQQCQQGEGVVQLATPWSDTECVSCKPGTFSNVTDSETPCRSHTNCTEIGQMLQIAGSSITDSVCIGKPSPPPSPPPSPKDLCWVLPASLWAGFAISAAAFTVLFILCYRRKETRVIQRRQSTACMDKVVFLTGGGNEYVCEEVCSHLLPFGLNVRETDPEGASCKTLIRDGAENLSDNWFPVSRSLDCLTPVKENTFNWNCLSLKDLQKTEAGVSPELVLLPETTIPLQQGFPDQTKELPMSLHSDKGSLGNYLNLTSNNNLNLRQQFTICDPSVTSDIEVDGLTLPTVTASECFGAGQSEIQIVVSPPLSDKHRSQIGNDTTEAGSSPGLITEGAAQFGKASSCPGRLGCNSEPQENEWTG